ncbi:hypothetical protein FQR65_LT07778 [Abscondita terminalis]|nr:hypothetical protein FQR65_LT07778 [Abscondita terminalis]
MMKLMVSLFLFTILVTTFAWTSIEITPIDENEPDVCVSKNVEVGKMHFGESKRLSNNCVKVECGRGKIVYAGCGSIEVDSACTIEPENLSLPYPDCCPRPICPETSD